VYPPFVAFPIPLNAAVSDPLVKKACLESFFLFHMLFLAHNSEPESWTRQIPWLRSPWPDDRGHLFRARKRDCQSGGATSRAEQIGPGISMDAARSTPLTYVAQERRCLPAQTRGLRNAQETALVPENGQGIRGSCQRRRMFAVLDLKVA
jgi:hypothetical protein